MHFLIFQCDDRTRERKRDGERKDTQKKPMEWRKETLALICIESSVYFIIYSIAEEREKDIRRKKILQFYSCIYIDFFIFRKKEWMRIALWFEYRFLASFYYCIIETAKKAIKTLKKEHELRTNFPRNRIFFYFIPQLNKPFVVSIMSVYAGDSPNHGQNSFPVYILFYSILMSL